MRYLPRWKNSTFNKYKNQTGQALLLVLLAMAVVLTVVLSVASRSITDVSVSTFEMDSLRAFSAAEAGIEDALLSNLQTDYQPVSEEPTAVSEYSYNKRDLLPGVGKVFEYPEALEAGDTATIWFVNHSDSGEFICDADIGKPCTRANRIDICWGKDSSSSEIPAILISIYYDNSGDINNYFIFDDYSQVKVKNIAIDPVSPRISYNDFDPISHAHSYCPSEYPYKTNLVLTPSNYIGSCSNSSHNCLIAMKVRFLYNDAPERLAVYTGNAGHNQLPSQGIIVESQGTAGSSTRNVSVLKGYPEPPSIFDAAIFSGTTITHN